MGASTKFQLRFKNRDAWHKDRCNGEIRLKSNLFQTTWDVTQRPTGRPAAFCASGPAESRPSRRELSIPTSWPKSAWPKRKSCFPASPASLDRRNDPRRLAEPTNPWSLGSYSYLPVGYATKYLGIEKEPEGHCFFAGEHTAISRCGPAISTPP